MSVNAEAGGSALRRAAAATEEHAPAMLNAGWLLLAVSALGLGVLGFLTGDFALNWQPVPEWVPGRTMLAYLSAGVFWTVGLGLFIAHYRQLFTIVLAALFLAWAVLLHGPAVAADPLSVLPWLGFTERLAVAAGALMLAATRMPDTPFARRSRLAGRIAFGASLPIFGLSHWSYAEFTANMIPAFIPAHLFLAYLTGAGHIAAGIAILTNVLARSGAIALAAMVSCFVLFLHVPRVMGDPGSRIEWTMLVIAMTIAGAAWCVAGSLARPARASQQ